ncbi:hypothetical protein GCM10009600_02020 [Oerskovia paurometabola]
MDADPRRRTSFRPGRPGTALFISTWEGLQVFDALHPGAVDVPGMVGEMLRREFGIG